MSNRRSSGTCRPPGAAGSDRTVLLKLGARPCWILANHGTTTSRAHGLDGMLDRGNAVWAFEVNKRSLSGCPCKIDAPGASGVESHDVSTDQILQPEEFVLEVNRSADTAAREQKRLVPLHKPGLDPNSRTRPGETPRNPAASAGHITAALGIAPRNPHDDSHHPTSLLTGDVLPVGDARSRCHAYRRVSPRRRHSQPQRNHYRENQADYRETYRVNSRFLHGHLPDRISLWAAYRQSWHLDGVGASNSR